VDDAIGRVPDAPYPHLVLTVRTEQGVSPATLVIALTVGFRGDDLDGPLDSALDLGQGLLNQALHLLKRLGRLHPVITYPLEAFGKYMLNLCGEVNYVARRTQMSDLL